MTKKRLMRSRDDKMIAGVCAGLANYFEIDPTLVRLAFVALILVGAGSPVLAYLVLWLIMPLEGREQNTPQQTVEANAQEMSEKVRQVGKEVQTRVAGPKNGS